MLTGDDIQQFVAYWRMNSSSYFCKNGGQDDEDQISFLASDLRDKFSGCQEMMDSLKAFFREWSGRNNPKLRNFWDFVDVNSPSDKDVRIPTSELCDWCGGTKRIPAVAPHERSTGEPARVSDYIPGQPYQPSSDFEMQKLYPPCVCTDERLDGVVEQLRNQHMNWYRRANNGEWEYVNRRCGVYAAFHEYLRRLSSNNWSIPTESNGEPDTSQESNPDRMAETAAEEVEILF